MASYFNITLDTLAPSGATFLLNGDDVYTATQMVDAEFSTVDGDTTGYEIKIWGDVDTSYDADVQSTENASAWMSYSATYEIKLSSGDGSKTVYAKIRDDVYNETSQLSDSITLDTTAPVVTITTNPDVSRISKVAGRDTVTFGWESDTPYDEYKIKVVPSGASLHTAGTTIGTSNGSTNMSGSTADQPASTEVTSTINGADLEAASAGDGSKVIKVFVKDDAGNWSVA
jgi:hypothetical protein